MAFRTVIRMLTLAYLCWVAWLTLGPQPLDDGSQGVLHRLIRELGRIDGLAWITYAVVEFTANIALFLPLGVLLILALGERLWWAAAAGGVALTLLIEFAQLFLPTRVSDPRDLLANTLGTAAGVAFAYGVLVYRRRVKRRVVTRGVRRRGRVPEH